MPAFQAETIATPETALDPSTASPAQILIVEDEKIIAKDLEIRLKRMNYQVVGSVTNAADCLALLRSRDGKVDLILMDIMIDGPKDGIDTAHEVRAIWDIPIIFLTAYADESTFQRAKLSDPFGYILKPFQERDLDLSIQTVLQKHRLERQIKENEARYRLLFESTQEAIVVLDDDSRFVDGNAAAEQLFGQGREELAGLTMQELSGLQEPDRFTATWARHKAEGAGTGRYKLRRTDGEVRYVDYSLRIGYMPQRHLAVLRDVTQKLADQRKIEALARIPDEAPTPVLRFSTAGQHLYSNHAAKELLGAWYKPDGFALPDAVRRMLAYLTEREPQASLVVQAAGRYYQLLAALVAKEGYVNIYATDVTDQHFSEALVGYQRDVLEQVAGGHGLEPSLRRLVEGLEQIVPDMAAMLIWRPAGQAEYKFVSSSTIVPDEARQFCETLHDLGQAPEARPGSPLEDFLREMQGEDAPLRLSAAVHPVPARTEGLAWLVYITGRERTLTPRESSVCKLALRLSATAFERDETYQRLYQQSLAFENIHDAIILTDTEGHVTEWSPSAERIFHFTKQDMVGRRLSDTQLFSYDVAGPGFRAPALADGRQASEIVFTRPDGQHGWAELSQVDMVGPGGSLLGRVQVARDITQKKHVEQQLNISEQHLKTIFDNSVQSFVLLDPAYKVVAFNAQAERWVAEFGKRKLRKGSAIAQFWPTGDAAKFKHCLRLAGGGEVCSYEDFLITEDDKGLWLEINLMPVRDNEGAITGICLTALDIGERKNNEQNLARSEARYRSLVQNSSDLVLLLNEEGMIDYASESSVRITGYAPDDMRKARLTRFVHERDKLRLMEALRRAIDREETSVQLEYRFISADGQTLTLESVITNELGNPSIRALVVNSRDITERKLAEESLRNIVRGVSNYSDEDFFVYLADNLAVHLGIPNVALAELKDGQLSALALVQHGSPAHATSLGPAGTFCQDVLHAGFLFVTNVQGSHYVQDPLLARFSPDFALGVALRSSDGKPLGVLVAAGPNQAAKLGLAENTLKVFSVRAAMELERIYSTRTLEANEANLTALVENTTDAIWSLDRQYRLTALNSSFRQRFAHLFTDGIDEGDPILEMMTAEEARLWRRHYDLALAGVRHTQEVAVISERGPAEYEVSFNPILTGREVTGVSVFARDITERKKAEAALRTSQANLSALIENTDDVIFSLDPDLKLVTYNSSFNRTLYELGAPAYPTEVDDIGEEAFGRNWEELYRRALKGEKFHQELPLTLDGENRSLEASFNPILTKDKSVEGVSVMARDVTERKRAEDALKQTNFELDSFVYRASHDLRAPLRSVLGLVNLIRIENEEDQKTKFLGMAEKSINKLDNFISDLTNFSRNSRLEVAATEIDFNAQIAECLDNLRYMEKADRVEPRVELHQEGPFFSDPQRIGIILQNLVSNAIKYQRTNVDSYVRVSIVTDADRCVLVVEDNGKGIQAEYLARIFEMFFRASEDSYGSGLGLYITQQVIEKLGGKMKVHSEYGEGTRFEIVIPNRVGLGV